MRGSLTEGPHGKVPRPCALCASVDARTKERHRARATKRQH
jgi:hypothetical protein